MFFCVRLLDCATHQKHSGHFRCIAWRIWTVVVCNDDITFSKRVSEHVSRFTAALERIKMAGFEGEYEMVSDW